MANEVAPSICTRITWLSGLRETTFAPAVSICSWMRALARRARSGAEMPNRLERKVKTSRLKTFTVPSCAGVTTLAKPGFSGALAPLWAWAVLALTAAARPKHSQRATLANTLVFMRHLSLFGQNIVTQLWVCGVCPELCRRLNRILI